MRPLPGFQLTEDQAQERVGPATISVGDAGKDLTLPADTPVYGTSCQLFAFGIAGASIALPASGDLTDSTDWPCFVQVGLKPDGQTIDWLFAPAYGRNSFGGTLTTTGTVRAVADGRLEFTNGTTLPFTGTPGVAEDCGADAPAVWSDLATMTVGFVFDVDPRSGAAIAADCEENG